MRILIVLITLALPSATFSADGADILATQKAWSLEDWRNLALTLAQRQTALNEAGQNIDRHQKGAQMLGDARLSVRQAGVAVLAKLAEQYMDDYFDLVQKVLCSFIQDRSREQREKWEEDMRRADDKLSYPAFAPDSQTAISALSDLKRKSLKTAACRRLDWTCPTSFLVTPISTMPISKGPVSEGPISKGPISERPSL